MAEDMGAYIARQQSMQSAEGANVRSSQSVLSSDSIGVGGQMIFTESLNGIDIGVQGNLDSGLQGFTGAMEKPLIPDLHSMEPWGINGVGVTNKDIQGAGNMAFTNLAPGEQFNAPAAVGSTGSEKGGRSIS